MLWLKKEKKINICINIYTVSLALIIGKDVSAAHTLELSPLGDLAQGILTGLEAAILCGVETIGATTCWFARN